MKVLNLQCARAHLFEGWFASEDDFQQQKARGLLECPLCGDGMVDKLPSAPRLNLRAARSTGPEGERQPPAAGREGMQPNQDPALQAAWLRAVRELMARTEDVGDRFAEEARRIHHGEADERAIRGQATPEDTRELLEEGIVVLTLPVPKALKDSGSLH